MSILRRPTIKNDSKSKGERSEAIIIGRLVECGYVVLTPHGDSMRYDLVIEDGDGQFWRVQCKTAWLSKDEGALIFNPNSNHYAYTWNKTSMVRRHYRGQCEYFAVYSPDTKGVYLVPVDEVTTTQAMLRLKPTKNNQAKHIRWAQDYEL